MDKIKTVKIKNSDGSVSEETYTISVDARNVDMDNGKELQETIGTIDIDTDGNIAEQLENLNDNVDDLNIDIKKKAYFFDTVADMKNANLKVGDYACTLGYYSANDGGAADYQIVSGNYTDDGGSHHKLKNNLYAELIIKNNFINAKQLGCKTNGFDNSLIINNYFNNNNNNNTLYFPKGQYYVKSEIDTIGSVIMNEDAWIVADAQMDCVIHINKNLTIPSGSFANNYPKNQNFKINVDCNKLANTGIRTDKLHWSKLILTVKNAIQYGVYTRYDSSKGHAENTFDIQTMYDSSDGTNTSTGAYIGGSDDIYNNIVAINTKYGVEIHGGDNSFETIHCWLVNKDLWNGSKMILISNQKNHISNLIVDTYETGIAFNTSMDLANGVFDYYIDFMYGLINTSFIPSELRSSYKLWDFSGMGITSRNNSVLNIMNYIGNDANTAKISLGGNGICPFNTSLNYKGDYVDIKWEYDLDYCPAGTFTWTGNSDVHGKPNNINSGLFILTTTQARGGKIQTLELSGSNINSGPTVYNLDNGQPISNYKTFYKRILSQWGTGNNPWAGYASFYIFDTYTPSESI